MNSAQSLIEQLQESLSYFIEHARSFPAAMRSEKLDEVKFSATEIVYHMLDVERLWQQRFSRLLGGVDSTFTAMDPDREARDSAYNEKDFEQGITMFQTARAETLALINSLGNEQLALTGLHTKYGEMSVTRALEVMTGHDRQHAAQLDRTALQLMERQSA